MCRANFSSRPIPCRYPLWGRRPESGQWLVVDVVLALLPWWTPWGPPAIRARLLFVLDVMAQAYRLLMPFRPPRWCAPYTAPSPSGALLLPVAALGRGQRLRGTGFGPLALVGPPLAEALSFGSVCPYGPTACGNGHLAAGDSTQALPCMYGGKRQVSLSGQIGQPVFVRLQDV